MPFFNSKQMESVINIGANIGLYCHTPKNICINLHLQTKNIKSAFPLQKKFCFSGFFSHISHILYYLAVIQWDEL